MTDSQLKIARQLYHPSDEVVNIVANICAILDKKGIGELHLQVFDPENPINLGCEHSTVNFLEREDSHRALLVHWCPDYNLSLNYDPFCSAYMLNENALHILYDVVMKTV